MRIKNRWCCVAVVFLSVSAMEAADWGLKKGNPDLKFAGPLAFGPDGIVLVGDPASVALFAIETGDTSGEPDLVDLNIDSLNVKVADALDASFENVSINDLAVNPASVLAEEVW